MTRAKRAKHAPFEARPVRVAGVTRPVAVVEFRGREPRDMQHGAERWKQLRREFEASDEARRAIALRKRWDDIRELVVTAKIEKARANAALSEASDEATIEKSLRDLREHNLNDEYLEQEARLLHGKLLEAISQARAKYNAMVARVSAEMSAEAHASRVDALTALSTAAAPHVTRLMDADALQQRAASCEFRLADVIGEEPELSKLDGSLAEVPVMNGIQHATSIGPRPLQGQE